MDLAALLIFAGALLIAAGSPGPSVAVLVARVITRGWRNARLLVTSPRALRLANRTSATILGGDAATLATQ